MSDSESRYCKIDDRNMDFVLRKYLPVQVLVQIFKYLNFNNKSKMMSGA